ncbi:MAG: branched-chain amino acid ABC transporter substrate-binding protein [Leptolinea sp.]
MKIFNSLSILIFIIITTLLLSGCGASPEALKPIPEVLPTQASTLPPEPTMAPPPTEMPTPIPVPTQTLFVPKATIKIISQTPLTGGGAFLGTDPMQSAELAVQQLAGPLNELGYKIEFVPYDDQGTIEVAVKNAKEIIADPEVLCGVGHLYSYIMIQASELYHKAGLAFISPSNTLSKVTDRGYLEVNRVVGRNDGQGLAGAQFAKVQGFKNIFIISNRNDDSQQILKYFKIEAKRLGLQVVGNITTDQTKNFETLVSKVIAANSDLVYFISNTNQGGAFFRDARAAGYMGAFLGTDSMDDSTLVETAGPLLIDGGGMSYTNMAAQASLYPDANKFVEDFQTINGKAPRVFGAESYDSAGICLKAIENASKAKNGEIPTRSEVAKAIRAIENYKGITGTYTFNGKGDPILAKYYVFKVVAVGPSEWNENTLVTTLEIAPPK